MSENVLTAEAIRRLDQQRAAAEDPSAISHLHTDDVIFDNVSTEPIVGKDAVLAHLEALFEEGEVMTLEVGEAVTLGGWGYTSGTWRVDKPGGGTDRGSYLHVMKPVDGELRIAREIFDVTEQS